MIDTIIVLFRSGIVLLFGVAVSNLFAGVKRTGYYCFLCIYTPHSSTLLADVGPTDYYEAVPLYYTFAVDCIPHPLFQASLAYFNQQCTDSLSLLPDT